MYSENVQSPGAVPRVVERFDHYLIGGRAEMHKRGGRCECGHFESVHVSVEHTDIGTKSDPVYPCTVCFAAGVDGDFTCTGFESASDVMPEPGTVRAARFGCTCDPAENMERALRGVSPEYSPECPVHLWVCQRGRCEHFDGEDMDDSSTIEHVGVHEFCDHCTNPFVVCERCEAMYIDWRVDPRLRGWGVKTASVPADTDDVVSLLRTAEWTCGRCA